MATDHVDVKSLGMTSHFLQEFFFRAALAEMGIVGGAVALNHQKGEIKHEAVGTVPLVFPMAYVRQAEALDQTKTQDYFFRGVISSTRGWLTNYPNVSESRYGRNPATKFHFDTPYYQNLCATRFALAPTGDCPWSYRFFEALMCRAIPILGDDEEDIFSAPFFFLRHSDVKVYNKEKADSNFQLFLSRHTLPGLGFAPKK